MEINPSWCQKQTFSCIYDSQHSAPVEARGQHATETPSSHPPAQRTAGCVWRSSGTKPRFSTWIQLHRFGVRRGVIKSYKALHNVAEKAAHFCLAYVTFSLGSHWLSDSGFTFLLRLTLSLLWGLIISHDSSTFNQIFPWLSRTKNRFRRSNISIFLSAQENVNLLSVVGGGWRFG